MAIGKAKGKQEGISLKPETYVAGGGYDDIDVRLENLEFVEFDYGGTIDTPILALAVTMNNLDADDPDDEKSTFTQHYSAGDLDFFVPSDDGKEIVPVGKKTGLSNSCNAALFLVSILEAEFPAEDFDKRVDVFEGMVCHVKSQAPPARKGLKEDTGKKPVLLVESIISLPGEEKKGKGGVGNKNKAGSKSNGATAGVKTGFVAKEKSEKPGNKKSKHGVADDVADLAVEYILTQLQAEGDGLSAEDLPKGVFAFAGPKGKKLDNKVRNAIIAAVGNEEFLNTSDLGWEFDGESLSATE